MISLHPMQSPARPACLPAVSPSPAAATPPAPHVASTPADAVEIVEASPAGRAALGGLPTRPTRIGAGCRVSRHLLLPAPPASDEPMNLFVRVVWRGGEHAASVPLQ